MMASFEMAWPNILDEEGSALVANDAGAGRSRYGITERYNPEAWIDGDVTIEEAKKIYENKHWRNIGGNSIRNQRVAGAIMDFGINAGEETSVKTAQKIIGAAVDGIVGSETIGKLNSYDETEFLNKFCIARIRYYSKIFDPTRHLPNQLQQWIERAKRYSAGISVGSATNGILAIAAVLSMFFFNA